MGKVILVKRKPIAPTPPTPNDQPQAKLVLFGQFDRACKADPRAEAGVVREWWERIFDGEYPPWDRHPYPMVKAKLMYELIKRDYEEAKIPLPPKILQNWTASGKFDVEGLTPHLRQMMRIELKAQTSNQQPNQPKGESTMVKKPQVPAEKVYESYIRLFTENFKKKLSDVQLAQEMCKAQPNKKKYQASDIKAVRSLFNNGKLQTMKGKPKEPSTEFGVVKPTEPKKKVVVLKPKK